MAKNCETNLLLSVKIRIDMSVCIESIVHHAIKLVESRGSDLKVKNLPGKVQKYEEGDFSIIYMTPFSGAEILPGEVMYGVDIWKNHKKVFSIFFKTFEDECLQKYKRAAWVHDFIAVEV